MNDRSQFLINAQLDGVITPEDFCELNALLKSDASVANAFAEASLLGEAIRGGFQTGTLSSRPAPEPSTVKWEPSKIVSFLPWGIAAAACLAALITFSKPAEENSPEPIITTGQEEFHDSGYAVLTRAVDLKWDSPIRPTASDFLPAGSYSLTSGLAQIEFFSGVSVVIEGDAQFEILSSDEMRMTRGKIRAHVPPPAIGFQIHTPHGTVLDLGTEFALDLSTEHHSLHVLDGEVEWHPSDTTEKLIRGGEAIHLDDQKIALFPSNSQQFAGHDQVANQLSKLQSHRYQDWQKQSLTLSQHPSLIAYFPMDELDQGTRLLKPTQSHLAHGAIVAAEVDPGRWPGKKSLDLSPNGSRVRVNIPGTYDQITFSAWTRIDSLDRQFNALFLTDNYNKGEPHWQLLNDGSLFFSVGLDKGRLHHIHTSPPVWTHSDSQHWLHLVTTYDCKSRTATHYLNGKQISQSQAPIKKDTPEIRFGSAQIGNWGFPTKSDPEFAVRNLNGSLDEFAIFSTTLSSTEVQQLYLSGKP